MRRGREAAVMKCTFRLTSAMISDFRSARVWCVGSTYFQVAWWSRCRGNGWKGSIRQRCRCGIADLLESKAKEADLQQWMEG